MEESTRLPRHATHYIIIILMMVNDVLLIYCFKISLTPYQYNFSDIVFGTRQKHSSRLWKVDASEENGREPFIQLLHEITDERSTVRSISVHPLAFSHGEYCELRSGKLTAYRNGFV